MTNLEALKQRISTHLATINVMVFFNLVVCTILTIRLRLTSYAFISSGSQVHQELIVRVINFWLMRIHT